MQATVTDFLEQRAIRFAKRVGVELEPISNSSGTGIYAFELTTGLELIDLPGMTAAGYWPSWRDSLCGLQKYLQEALGSNCITTSQFRGTTATLSEIKPLSCGRHAEGRGDRSGQPRVEAGR